MSKEYLVQIGTINKNQVKIKLLQIVFIQLTILVPLHPVPKRNPQFYLSMIKSLKLTELIPLFPLVKTQIFVKIYFKTNSMILFNNKTIPFQ